MGATEAPGAAQAPRRSELRALRSVKPVGTALLVAREASEARREQQREAEVLEAGESMVMKHELTPGTSEVELGESCEVAERGLWAQSLGILHEDMIAL